MQQSDVLSRGCVVGLHHDCEGRQLPGNSKHNCCTCNQGLYQRKLVGRATAPGESLHVDVASQIVPMGIGQVKYVLLAVELTRYA